MNIVLSVLLVGIATSAANVGYVAPVASGFIYRNDHNGPASLIQLGSISYQQPHLFAPPLPLAQPLTAQPLTLPTLKAIEAYDLEPAPLPYVAAKPIVDEDEDEDSEESLEEYSDGDASEHGHAFEKDDGSDYDEEHHAAHGEKGSKGYKTSDYLSKGVSGHYGNQHNEGFSKEQEGKVKSHHAEVDAHGKDYASGKEYEGSDHGHKKHFSKGEDITGYHKVFHKDEFKKDHDFYDVADNSGKFKKYGSEKQKHDSKKGNHKKSGQHEEAAEEKNFEKAGSHSKSNNDESNHNHSAEEGHESHHRHGKEFSRNGGSTRGKQHAFEQDDDEIEEEED